MEIGANSTVDRGHVLDTVIGEGTKIDNLVQIAHNVEIGRHCVIVSQVGISGSARLGDFVMLGGQVGVNNHVTVGSGAQIAATSIVKDDVPEGARWGGRPAKPVREGSARSPPWSGWAGRGRTRRTEGRGLPMNETTTSIDTAEIQKILSVLPHRYPFLLIDRSSTSAATSSASASRT